MSRKGTKRKGVSGFFHMSVCVMYAGLCWSHTLHATHKSNITNNMPPPLETQFKPCWQKSMSSDFFNINACYTKVMNMSWPQHFQVPIQTCTYMHIYHEHGFLVRWWNHLYYSRRELDDVLNYIPSSAKCTRLEHFDCLMNTTLSPLAMTSSHLWLILVVMIWDIRFALH